MSQFIPSRGLCASISAMFRDDKEMEFKLITEMQKQFDEAGMDHQYPFGEFDYRRRAKRKAMHKCALRLAWVRAQITFLREGQSAELTEFYRAWYEWATKTRPAYEESLNQAMIHSEQM